MTKIDSSENVSRDFLDGSFITDIKIEKLANGYFKASSMGKEANSYSQEDAIGKLQTELHEAMLRGEIHPEM